MTDIAKWKLMTEIMRLFDSYSRQARLYPALILLLPPLLTIIAWYPDLLSSSAAATALTLATSCGLLYALASFARSRGKTVEQRLLAEWGGWPTTLWLRHSDRNLPTPTKLRYHAALQRYVSRVRLPTAGEEAADPRTADEAYRSVVEWLKERCRGEKYPLVEKENAEYGFRRNLRGLRMPGVVAVLLALLGSGFGIWRASNLTMMDFGAEGLDVLIERVLRAPTPLIWGAVLVDLVALGFWLFVVRDRWVRQAGDQYTRALLSNCESL